MMLCLRLLCSFFPLSWWFAIPPPAIPLPEQREDLESSEEIFDLESLSSSSEDFFHYLSRLSEEEFLSVSETLSTPPEDNNAPPEAAAQHEETPEVERKHFPVLVTSFVVIYIGIFIITMYVNNCTKHTLPTTACFPRFLGRLSFQPTDQNPLYGPSRETLIKMGGLYLRNVLHMHQAWRLFSNIWLHEGFTQLLTDVVSICGVGIRLEQQFGFVRVGLLYLISGLGGSLVSALFIKSRVTVGASGALAGLAGGAISKTFIEYWTLHLPMGFDLSLAVFMMLINVVVTIVQHGDNFVNLGGSIVGVLFGFVIFIRPPVNRLRSTALLIIVDWDDDGTKRGEFERSLLMVSLP
ncbi:RHOMBOID-like protein 2 [Trifolium pratense]|uniref:RHOMBOID-like protein 2 n=1 Tax=Trifolium pratense TaxID=57577 RepID=UPI001E697F30|nr:RHOMBOID-like protein 2 [Trifolium pratense]